MARSKYLPDISAKKVKTQTLKLAMDKSTAMNVASTATLTLESQTKPCCSYFAHRYPELLVNTQLCFKSVKLVNAVRAVLISSLRTSDCGSLRRL